MVHKRKTRWFEFKVLVTGADRYDAYDNIVKYAKGGVQAEFVKEK